MPLLLILHFRTAWEKSPENSPFFIVSLKEVFLLDEVIVFAVCMMCFALGVLICDKYHTWRDRRNARKLP